MKKIAITGGSGYLGTWVIKEFKENGYEILNIDMKYLQEKLCKTLIANLTNHGEAY
ncbi:MAG: NAD(P)-dependent oxidoreductase [Gracilibacteraceae bacterium]|nr:NAD(P)-dependent oxidoreductase [Gracilibacteraceae bacterium]